MSEPTNRDWMEIREWLVRIDTKVDYLTEVKTKAERAEAKADKALQKSDDHAESLSEMKEDFRKEIDGIKTTSRWAIGLTVTSILTATGIIVAIVF
ncbi:hemolysin XhlA family protein [Bacillus sp. ISL-37]|uniref:hemolysin XhlA family protein n=1 Tax=Bacillus sp. ISL-37 TaxID=2819123 RepID=UPI001BE93D77|nr:hemolysin XhlA family protein [Bacillus sp. ISL-37]MBT2682667.1 hypothetical protein [Bacillus sp. ISL-37]